MSKRTYVWRDGALVEITPGSMVQQTNVPSTGDFRDRLHSCGSWDDVREQHMTDSNRTERAYNKERGK